MSGGRRVVEARKDEIEGSGGWRRMISPPTGAEGRTDEYDI